MEKDSHSQLELFSDGSDARPHAALRVDNPFVNFIRACEKKAWAAVAFIVVGVVAFSVGVERGRRVVASKPAVKVSPKVRTVAPAKAEKAASAKTTSVKGKFMIQLGTFTQREYAEQEVKDLKKKGFPAVMVKDGKHTLVCVGTFENKETAQTYAKRFKGVYKSCLIRRF